MLWFPGLIHCVYHNCMLVLSVEIATKLSSVHNRWMAVLKPVDKAVTILNSNWYMLELRKNENYKIVRWNLEFVSEKYYS